VPPRRGVLRPELCVFRERGHGDDQRGVRHPGDGRAKAWYVVHTLTVQTHWLRLCHLQSRINFNGSEGKTVSTDGIDDDLSIDVLVDDFCAVIEAVFPQPAAAPTLLVGGRDFTIIVQII
jgi:hypothetical protein